MTDVEWRKTKSELSKEYVEILSWFADHPDAPFSIHKFVKHGEISCATSPGEWFGPSAASRCIQYDLPQSPMLIGDWYLRILSVRTSLYPLPVIKMECIKMK